MWNLCNILKRITSLTFGQCLGRLWHTLWQCPLKRPPAPRTDWGSGTQWAAEWKWGSSCTPSVWSIQSPSALQSWTGWYRPIAARSSWNVEHLWRPWFDSCFCCHREDLQMLSYTLWFCSSVSNTWRRTENESSARGQQIQQTGAQRWTTLCDWPTIDQWFLLLLNWVWI